jgi:hypothetical protein
MFDNEVGKGAAVLRLDGISSMGESTDTITLGKFLSHALPNVIDKP